jgi:hypothetical protein
MKELLSASDGGAGIPIKVNGGKGSLVHAAPAKDAVHLWLSNSATEGQTATVLVGGRPAPVFVPPMATVLAVPGWLVSDGKEIWVAAEKPGAMHAFGFVERYAAAA